MSKKRVAAFAATLAAAGLLIGGVLPSAAEEPPPPITSELLTDRAEFTDDVGLTVKLKEGQTSVVKADDPSRTVVARFTVQPGAQFPWHSHAGPVVVNVVAGALTYVTYDCAERNYPAGTAFVDLGHGDVHSAFNPSADEVTVLVATFFEAPPAPDSLLIPGDPPACALS